MSAPRIVKVVVNFPQPDISVVGVPGRDGMAGNVISSVQGRTGDVVLTKSDLALGNVDNTSDALKPISNATASALAGKQATINYAGARTIFVRKGAAATDTRTSLSQYDATKPFATLAAALAAAVSGDLVDAGAGTFLQTAGLDIPHGVSLRGAGRELTVITNATVGTDAGPGDYCIVCPGDNSQISDLRIEGTAPIRNDGTRLYQGIVGAAGYDKQFQNAALRNVHIAGDSDGVFFRRLSYTDTQEFGRVYGPPDQSNPCTMRLYDCLLETAYDNVVLRSAGVVELFNCVQITAGGSKVPSWNGTATGVGAVLNGATARIYGGSITVSGGTSYNYGAFSAQGSSARVELYKVRLDVSGTGALDLSRASGTLAISGSFRADGAALVTSGTITKLDVQDGRANTLLVATNGSDSVAVRASANRPYLTVRAALAAAVSGDVVELGPGTFNDNSASLILPANVSLRGAGRDVTFITSTLAESSGAIIVPGNNSQIESLTIQGTAGSGVAQAPLGLMAAQVAFGNAVLRNVRIVADAVAIKFASSDGGTSLLRAYDCLFETMAGAVAMANVGTLEFYNCDAIVAGPSTVDSANSYGLNAQLLYGIVRWFGGKITVSGGGTTNIGASAQSYGQTILYNTRIDVSGPGALDLKKMGSGVIKIANIVRPDGAALVTSGVYTRLTRYCVFDNNLSDLPSPATARANLFPSSTLSYAATTVLDFSGAALQTLTLAGNVTFTTSNLAAAKSVVVRIIGDGSSRTLTFPAGWKFIGSAAPDALAAGKTAILSLTAFGSSDSTILAAYAAEP